MSLVVLEIKNEEKGRYLIDFLKQIDYLEVMEGAKLTRIHSTAYKPESLADFLLNAPVLSEEEIHNIEEIGKEINNWTINEL